MDREVTNTDGILALKRIWEREMNNGPISIRHITGGFYAVMPLVQSLQNGCFERQATSSSNFKVT